MGKASINNECLQEMANLYLQYGPTYTANALGFTTDTINRYIRLAKKRGIITLKGMELGKLAEKYNETTLHQFAVNNKPPETQKPIYDFTGKTIKFGIIGDTHLGSIYTNPEDVYRAYDVMEAEECEFFVHPGDVTEGMSHRPGHIYQVSHLGYNAQRDHAIEVLSKAPMKGYLIDGNHDRWFIKSNGANIVKNVCEMLDNMEYLGHDEADIQLSKNCILRLWHGEDSSSYALSYRLQKLVESFTGGEKPHILVAGHVHKAMYCYIRHVHCISSGSIQKQTQWMRGKRIPAHTGFWIAEVTINKKGVGRFKSEWFPFYM